MHNSINIRRVFGLTALALTASLLSATAAHAQTVPNGYSVDIEFVHPSFGHGSFVGVEVPMTRAAMAWRYGAVVQYENDPLTVYDAVNDVELGSVVADRFDVQLGASLDLSERVSLGLRVPMDYNTGDGIQEFAANGFGMGDLGAGARVVLLKTRRDVFNLGLRGGLSLPSGRRNFYTGETGIRATVGGLAVTNAGPLRVAVDGGLVGRTPFLTTEDFTVGNEVTMGLGSRLALPAATRTAFTGQLLTRAGLENFLGGGAENALEVIGGVQVLPSRAVTIDIGAGRGFNEGYGTTDLRILSGITVQHVPAPPDEPVIIEGPPPPPPPPPPPVEELPEPEPEWQENELVRVVADVIQIRDMLDFRVDTNILLEESRPTLQAIADIINDDARIGHVVIEGHASQEGAFDYNYKLSESRARAIFEELFSSGVHPSRISYRSMGEVEPLVEGDDEDSLQKNRRVEFHIVKQFDAVEDMPDYDISQILPWTGEGVTINVPEKPVPVEEETSNEPKLDEFGLPIFDDDDIDIDAPEGDDATETEGDE